MNPSRKPNAKRDWPAGTHALVVGTLGVASVALIRVAGVAMPYPLVLLEAQALTLLLLAWPLLAIALWTKHKKTSIALALVVAVHLYWGLEWLPNVAAADGARAAGFRVVAANLLAMRPSDAYAEELTRTRADVIFLEELSTEWQALLERKHFFDAFPHRVLEPHPVAADNFGLGVVSRYPIVEQERIAFGEARYPLLRIDLAVRGKRLRAYAVHTVPPVADSITNLQYRQHDILIARLLNDVADPDIDVVIAGGDFNATPSAYSYRRYRDVGLVAAHEAASEAFDTTWPNGTSIFPPVRLDHVFVHGAGVHAVRQGRGEGSDHAPVIVDLIIPPAE